MRVNLNTGRRLVIVLGLAFSIAACGGSSLPPTDAPDAPVVAATEVTVAEPADVPAATVEVEPAEVPAPTATVESEPTEVPARAEEAEISVNTKLDLNEVTEAELLSTIPNFSNRMVREFLEYRPYISIQQFRREIGKYVSAEQVVEYEQYVYVPVDVNEADAETLKQLPGVDDAVAATLIAHRPYDSNAAFLEALALHVPSEELAAAASYLVAQ
ncbi:MAG: helix-hairpin-helix domain-containing protein [Ardenticatenaceae bacterium]|nr:helix-hairpin-helix domain-containing protein [Ardenticatenaceae bacterium]